LPSPLLKKKKRSRRKREPLCEVDFEVDMFHEYSASVHYEEGDEERISSMREQRDGTVRGGGGMQTIVSHRQLPSLQLPTDGTKQKVVGAQNLALK
jgi:hypothetical protein